MVDRTQIPVPTDRGTILPGTLFREGEERTASVVVIAITGIHGNFWSNPFYYDFGDTLAAAGIDFVYAETNDAQGAIRTLNWRTRKEEVIGSFCEDLHDVDDDVGAYVRWARAEGYDHAVLAGHSLGANKVIHYLSNNHDPYVSHFVLLSPANMDFLLGQVDEGQRTIIDGAVARGEGDTMLPFDLFGWAPMLARTAYQWIHDNPLDNVHLSDDRDFTQVERITQTGALFIGTYDAFALGDPVALVTTTSAHFPRAAQNQIVLIPQTGHTYQQRERYTAEALRDVILGWEERKEAMPLGG